MEYSLLSRMLGVIGATSLALDLVSDLRPTPAIPSRMLSFGSSQVENAM